MSQANGAVQLRPFEQAGQRLAGPDLARAFAIICVILTHDGGLVAGFFHVPLPFEIAILGFFGVMAFFVLSGLLIGTIILDLLAREARAKDWGVFVLRRWARTLPAYFVWMAIIAALTPLGGQSISWAGLGQVWPFYVTLTQNLLWKPVSFWFGQSWSLTIEEWFYLCFPALLVAAALCRLSRKAAFSIVLAAFFVIPVGLRLHLPPDVNWDEVTSKIVPLRFDSLAWGIAAAWVLRAWPWVIARLWAPCFVVGAVVVLGVWLSSHLPFSLWGPHFQRVALFDVVGAGFALCTPAVMRLRRLYRPFGALVRSISTHSYGLYLCHLPLALLTLRLHEGGLGRTPALALLVVSTLGGAALSWRLVERPFLRLRPRQTP